MCVWGGGGLQDITMITVLLDCSLNPRHMYNIAKFTLYYLGFPETRFKAPGWFQINWWS